PRGIGPVRYSGLEPLCAPSPGSRATSSMAAARASEPVGPPPEFRDRVLITVGTPPGPPPPTSTGPRISTVLQGTSSRPGWNRRCLGDGVMLRLNVTLGAASARNRERLLEGLQYQVPGTRLEPGCLGCSAWVAADWSVRYF